LGYGGVDQVMPLSSKTVRIVVLAGLSKFTSNRLKVGQMEAAKACNRCRDAQQSAMKERTKWPLRDTKHAQMLSSLSYSLILSTIKARAFDRGVSVTEVNPAYTSVIGRNKFRRRYGLVISPRRSSGNRAAVFTILGETKPAWRPWHLPRTCMESRRACMVVLGTDSSRKAAFATPGWSLKKRSELSLTAQFGPIRPVQVRSLVANPPGTSFARRTLTGSIC
jgi:hypothetical protein